MRVLRPCLGLLGTLALAGLPAPAGAQPVGEEFQINTYTTFSQETATQGRAVAADATGNFVVVWESRLQDGDLGGIFAQRYDSEGQPLGTEFRVNTSTEGDQIRPSVAAAADGRFVVVWEGSGIVGRRFDSTGQPQGGEFRVSNGNWRPSVALNAEADFVVTWEVYSNPGASALYAQGFDSEGVAQGEEFLVTSDVDEGDVAADATGNFIVVWGFSNTYGRRFDIAGQPLGDTFQVNSYTTDGQGLPSVAVDASGNFVVVWQSYGQDGSGSGIFGQRFDAAGNAVGSEFSVSSYTTGEQWDASVASDESGNFIVVWTSNGQDGDLLGSFGQRYDSAGLRQGGEFQVNSFTTSRQYKASASATGSDQFVVVWSSLFQDGNGHGVFGQRFGSPAGAITVVNPNTNVKWRIGSLQRIKWTHNLGPGATFRIRLDRDDDGDYEELIAAAAPADSATKGHFAWTVTGPVSGMARMCVSWNDDVSVSDVSDVTFQIRPAPLDASREE